MTSQRRAGYLELVRVNALLTLAAATLAASAACNPFQSPAQSFVIRVDSISAPNRVGATEHVDIRFYGRIGSDQCSRVTHIAKQLTSGGFEITFHGERVRGNCAQMPALLDHLERLAPPLADPFTISVVQPTGSPLVQTVQIGND